MIDVTELVGIVFSGLSVLVIEAAEDAGEVICVQAMTGGGRWPARAAGRRPAACTAITSGQRRPCPRTAGFTLLRHRILLS
jgi:hypothetical protein